MSTNNDFKIGSDELTRSGPVHWRPAVTGTDYLPNAFTGIVGMGPNIYGPAASEADANKIVDMFKGAAQTRHYSFVKVGVAPGEERFLDILVDKVREAKWNVSPSVIRSAMAEFLEAHPSRGLSPLRVPDTQYTNG